MKTVLLLFVVLLASCGARHPDTVVVIEKTKTFHRENCSRVRMAHTTTISFSDATAQGMKPCPYCKPVGAP
jgi:methylphosphotriester-DNA--protein-cysteine methyltransferase